MQEKGSEYDRSPRQRQSDHTHVLVVKQGSLLPAFEHHVRDRIRDASMVPYGDVLEQFFLHYIPFIPFISAYLIFENRQTIFSGTERSTPRAYLHLRRPPDSVHDKERQRAIRLSRSSGDGRVVADRDLDRRLYALLRHQGRPQGSFPLLSCSLPYRSRMRPWSGSLSFSRKHRPRSRMCSCKRPVPRSQGMDHIPPAKLDIEIAKECSGIRSSLSLAITGLLASYFFLRTTWARAILLLSIVPIAIIKNGIRITVLSVLGVYWDERILAGDLHRKGGIVFFLLALLLVGAVIIFLRRWNVVYLERTDGKCSRAYILTMRGQDDASGAQSRGGLRKARYRQKIIPQ